MPFPAVGLNKKWQPHRKNNMSKESMGLEYRTSDRAIIIDGRSGFFDINHSQMEAFLTSLVLNIIDEIDGIIVDCEQYPRIASHGIGNLVAIHREMKRYKKQLALIGVKGFIHEVLNNTGLLEHFKLFDSESDARAFLTESAS